MHRKRLMMCSPPLTRGKLGNRTQEMIHRKRLTIDDYRIGWRVAGLAEASDAGAGLRGAAGSTLAAVYVFSWRCAWFRGWRP